MKVHLVKFTSKAKHKLNVVKLSNINNRFIVVDKGDLKEWLPYAEIKFSDSIKNLNPEVVEVKTTSKIEQTFLIQEILITKK